MSGPITGIGVTGLDQTVAALNALPAELAKTGLVRACKAAMAPVLEKAKELCPVLYGFLRDCLISRAKRLKDGATFVCIVGVERGQKFEIDTRTRGKNKGEPFFQEPSKITHLVEFGTSTREATPFLRPAAVTEAVNAIDIFQTEIEKEIDKAVLKVAYKT